MNAYMKTLLWIRVEKLYELSCVWILPREFSFCTLPLEIPSSPSDPQQSTIVVIVIMVVIEGPITD